MSKMINFGGSVDCGAIVSEKFWRCFCPKGFSAESIVILLKNPSRLFSFLRSLADEEEFVAGVDFPLHHLPWFDINGRSERQRQVNIALRDSLLAADGLDFGWVVHFVTLVN